MLCAAVQLLVLLGLAIKYYLPKVRSYRNQVLQPECAHESAILCVSADLAESEHGGTGSRKLVYVGLCACVCARVRKCSLLRTSLLPLFPSLARFLCPPVHVVYMQAFCNVKRLCMQASLPLVRMCVCTCMPSHLGNKGDPRPSCAHA